MAEEPTVNLSENLAQLTSIADWFEQQQEVDVEEGLKKVKQAAGLIKESKQRLRKIENEFVELKRDVEAEIGEEEPMPG